MTLLYFAPDWPKFWQQNPTWWLPPKPATINNWNGPSRLMRKPLSYGRPICNLSLPILSPPCASHSKRNQDPRACGRGLQHRADRKETLHHGEHHQKLSARSVDHDWIF